MLAATVFIGFVVLGLVCLAVLGVPLGILAWLLFYGLFRFITRSLLTHIGDSGDLYHHERVTRPRPVATSPHASANTRRQRPSPQEPPF